MQTVETTTSSPNSTNAVLAAGWISVEDNLPPKNGRYLVTCDNHLYSPYVCVYSTEYGSQYHWNIPAGRVTHWMELPLPPACR